MKANMTLLRLRMWLNIDPWARAANRRLAELQRKMDLERIRIKAITYQATHTDEIVIGDVEDDGGETVFDLPSRQAPDAVETDERSLTAITDEGLEVAVYDPTDTETADLMRQYELGDVRERERAETLGHMVDTTPPPAIEWDGPEENDPFSGVKRL